MILDVLYSTLVLGLPVAILAGGIFLRMFETGVLARDADKNTLQAGLDAQRERPVIKQVVRLGGGFYGFAALWTLLVLELQGIGSFLWHLPDSLPRFSDGLGPVISALVTNQVDQFVSALVWFKHWNDGNMLVNLVVAIAGYQIGIGAARRISADRVKAGFDRWRKPH